MGGQLDISQLAGLGGSQYLIVDCVTRLCCNESPFILIIGYCSTCHLNNKGFGQSTNSQLLYECVLCNIVIVNLPAGVSSIQICSVSVI